ncbi:NAD(P)H-dependent glycerol-3-phosphate dehydrogenase [Chloroflexota bacterium]
MPRITIIGTTSWGKTLGIMLARNKQEVRMWARTEQEAIELSKAGPNPTLPPGVTFPSHLSVTSSMSDALDKAKAVILAVPSQTVRKNIKLVAPHLNDSILVISAAKGLEIDTHKRMSEVISEEIDPHFQHNICVLSGPNLSREVIRDLPAASVIAAEDEAVAQKARQLLTTPNFCIYTNTDVIGVELGGALKNIIALGAGMIEGLGYGDNAKAAFVTRGLTEMTALGVALGSSPLTLSGLSGLGDVIATCASSLSRNHYVGVELTKGRILKEITATMTGISEGASTVIAVWSLAQQLEMEMPVTEKIYQILYEGLDPRQIMIELLENGGKHELTGRKWKLTPFFQRTKQR